LDTNSTHRPASGLERGMPSIEDFYRPDEVKYHGKDNRGFATINFFGKIKVEKLLIQNKYRRSSAYAVF
jgi:hypothetical protein